MKKALLISIFLVLTCKSDAQIWVYKTYADYTNNIATEYDDYKDLLSTPGKTNFVFLKNGEKVKVNCLDMWGFKYKADLFRVFVERYAMQVGWVVSTGKMTYYELGQSHIFEVQKGKMDKKPSALTTPGFSIGLNDPYVMGYLPVRDPKKPTELTTFWAAHPEHAEVYTCLKEDQDLLHYRACFEAYQKK